MYTVRYIENCENKENGGNGKEAEDEFPNSHWNSKFKILNNDFKILTLQEAFDHCNVINGIAWVNDSKGNLFLQKSNRINNSGKLLEINKNDVVRLGKYSSDNLESYGSYSRLETYEYVTPNDFYRSNYFTSSDYSGSFVELSNRQYFLEEFKDIEGIYGTYGGYGTKSLVIKISSITSEMLKCLNSLEDYPVLCEYLMSELESEEQNKSYEYFDYDFKKAVMEKFEFDINEEECGEKGNDKFGQLLYWKCMEKSDYPFVMEGLSVYVDIDKMLEDIDENDFNCLIDQVKSELYGGRI